MKIYLRQIDPYKSKTLIELSCKAAFRSFAIAEIGSGESYPAYRAKTIDEIFATLPHCRYIMVKGGTANEAFKETD